MEQLNKIESAIEILMKKAGLPYYCGNCRKWYSNTNGLCDLGHE